MLIFWGATLISIIVVLILYYRIVTLKAYHQYLVHSHNTLLGQYSTLQQENIQLLQTVERLNSKILYLEQATTDADRIKQELFESTKAALFDLGSNLSKQLIELHKQETCEAREIAAKNIESTTAKFQQQFERLIGMIGGISRDVEQSKGAVNIIRESLLSPTCAGKFAEITLENVLKSSGLRSNIDFIMQYTVLNHTESSRLRPDAVIFLPSNNLMVVDAKASKFLLKKSEDQQLIKSMNNHLKSLSSKEYAEHIFNHFQHRGIEFNNIITLMFLPTEHAVEQVLLADSEFLHKAWAANIFPVGPTGLMNMLSFAKFQIAEHMRIENHRLIIEEIRKLLMSINIIAEHSNKLGSSLQNMVGYYDKFAASFNKNFLLQAKKIEKLGINVSNKESPALLERYQLMSTKSELSDTTKLKTLEDEIT